MKLYVAGPMRGYEEFNFPAFHEATALLRAEGHEVTSPAEMDLDMGLDPTIANTDAEHDFDVEDALRRDFEVILQMDGIALLDGWENSSGARAERFVAETTGKQVFKFGTIGKPPLPCLDPAPDWDGDPRKPQLDPELCDARPPHWPYLSQGESFDLAHQAELSRRAATTAQEAHEAQHERYRQALDIEQQKLLTNGAMKRVTTPDSGAAGAGFLGLTRPTVRYMEEQPNSFTGMARGLTENCKREPLLVPPDAVVIDGNEDSTNPKDRLGVKKPQLHLVPRSLIIRVAQAMKDGAAKYGPFNWRTKGVRASVYVDAADRHLGAWFDGEECAADSGVPHLAHAAACIGILIDAEATGNLVDDRPTPGPAARMIAELTES